MKPQDLPSSGMLLALVLVTHTLVGVAVAAVDLRFGPALAVGVIDTALMCGLTTGLLILRTLRERTVQTLTALAGAGSVIGFLAYPVSLWLHDAHNANEQLPALGLLLPRGARLEPGRLGPHFPSRAVGTVLHRPAHIGRVLLVLGQDPGQPVPARRVAPHMHVHFLGICGTFMAGLALIARELGHRVTGSDRNVYPPMSSVLDGAGIDVIAGYDPAQLSPAPDVVVIGNAITRGNPCVEHILEMGLWYTSGPGWLSEHVLAHRHVIAVAGTHGKTTTTAMLAVILDDAGLDPGFLIAGVPHDLDTTARIGRGGPRGLFVIEADEYDTAFFDKRSKFVHYRPRTLVLNNIEFDHADIFNDLGDMQRQFHHVVRIVPSGGQIVAGAGDPPDR